MNGDHHAPPSPPSKTSTYFQIYFLHQYHSFQNYYLAIDAFRTFLCLLEKMFNSWNLILTYWCSSCVINRYIFGAGYHDKKTRTEMKSHQGHLKKYIFGRKFFLSTSLCEKKSVYFFSEQND